MWSRTFVAAASLLTLVSFQAASLAQTPGVLHRIEEDWEMVINDPDPETNSPQVSFVISPNATDEGCYFQLQMNYAADETYSSGGFQVSAVRDDVIIEEARSAGRSLLSYDNETVRWTTVMAAIDGRLFFAVKDGSGQSFGEFGGPEYLVRMSNDHIADLSEYTPSKSVEMVDIGFGGNRVASVVLKTVRLYYADGTVQTVAVNASP